MLQDEVTFHGHPNVQSLHTRTIEVTKDDHLSLRGDCIIGVQASKGCSGLDEKIKERLRQKDSVVKMDLFVASESFSIVGSGDSRLTLRNTHDIVIRKTNFVCPRTMSVMCDKASSDIPRRVVRLLQNKETRGIFRISIE
ncbi:MAG: DUF371 domain-containing protein [Nitrososphaera sp.]|nr:DUF371 domain-containing protein [Nitrososphaera sp.]